MHLVSEQWDVNGSKVTTSQHDKKKKNQLYPLLLSPKTVETLSSLGQVQDAGWEGWFSTSMH